MSGKWISRLNCSTAHIDGTLVFSNCISAKLIIGLFNSDFKTDTVVKTATFIFNYCGGGLLMSHIVGDTAVIISVSAAA